MRDLRFTARQLRRMPGFTVTAILTLALGIGATTAIFSLVNAVLLRPLPFPEPDRLISIAEGEQLPGASARTLAPSSFSYPDFFDWRAANRSFRSMAAWREAHVTLTGRGDARRLDGVIVSSGFFHVLGAQPSLGRDFLPEDEKSGAFSVVLSDALWRSEFAESPDIIGRSITLDDRSYTIVGVMPAGFTFPITNSAPALWRSFGDDGVSDDGDKPMTAQRGAHMLSAIGRLKNGVSIEQARADLSRIAANLAAQYPDSNKGVTGAIVKPELEEVVGDTRPALRVLFAAVTLLLLIACANVAGLLLARTARRRPEIALRGSLGASRFEIVRQIFTEAILLSAAGGALGIFVSRVILDGLLRFLPNDLPRGNHIEVDAPVLIFVTAVSVLTGLLFGVAPAWRMSRIDPALALREGSRSVTSARGQHRLHDWLVISETALGLVLLVGAGLLIRSFIHVLNVDPGFQPRQVLTANLGVSFTRYPGARHVHFYDELMDRVRALPGVQSVALGWPLPLTDSHIGISFQLEERPLAEGDRPTEDMALTTPGFFATIGIPILQGRDFTNADNPAGKPVVIINRAFARKYFPGENPVGKRMQPGLGDGVMNHPMREIVAVVGDVKERGLTTAVHPEYYLPFAQAVVTSPPICVRAAGDPLRLAAALRAQVAALDKDVTVTDVRTLEDYVTQAASKPRFQTVLLSAFAALALLLAAVGLYAVLSYMVAQRTVEIGVRMALGAQRDDVLGMVLRRGLRLALIGLAAGVCAAAMLTRFLEGMLYGVSAFDPVTFATVAALLLLVSLLASSAPALRASRVDPMRTLREQ